MIQLGLTKSVEQARIVAQYISETFDRTLDAVDDFPHVDDSFLKGLNIKTADFFRAPPTVHPRCNIWTDCPSIEHRLLFLNLTTDRYDLIEDALDWVRGDTIVVGTMDACNYVLRLRELTAQPMYYLHDRVAIRID